MSDSVIRIIGSEKQKGKEKRKEKKQKKGLALCTFLESLSP